MWSKYTATRNSDLGLSTAPLYSRCTSPSFVLSQETGFTCSPFTRPTKMNLTNAALSDKPEEWKMVRGKYDARVIVSRYTMEYDEIVEFVNTKTVETCDVKSVVRVQNTNSWAQFLYRCQYLKVSGAVYHVVRKGFVLSVLSKTFLRNLHHQHMHVHRCLLKKNLELWM